tara:strand:- start:241 stop:666 length:426 start_codon:yes stop_codon:yes gene_type:complete
MEVYTDGSCKNNPGKGGWAFIVYIDNCNIYENSGYEPDTTNNRMELMAMKHALEYLVENNICKCKVFTDSQYVQKGLLYWVHKWIQKESKQKNLDLWLDIYNLYYIDLMKCDISIEWVKAHATNEKNNKVDQLAKSHTLHC